MRYIWDTALKDWRRHRRDPFALLLWIGLPFLVGALLVMVSGGRGGPQPQAHVLVADEDGSFLSSLVVGAMSQDALHGLINAESVDRVAGRARLDKGEVTALLIIPEGFGKGLLAETPVKLELITNPSQTILPRIVEQVLSMLTDAAFYLHRLIGDDLRELAMGPPAGAMGFPDSRIAALSMKINQVVIELRPVAFPPVIQIETPRAEEDGDSDGLGVAFLFLPSILFMALLFMAQGLSMDLWQEHDGKTLRRAAVSPHGIMSFLVGKLLASAGLVSGVALLALIGGYAYFGLNVVYLPLALFWTVLSGALLTTLMMTIQVHTATRRAGGILSMAIMFPLMMIGGSFFPFEAMPAPFVLVGKLTPNGWALERLKNILAGRVDPATLGMSFVGIVALGSLLFLLSARRVRSRFVQD